MHYSFISIVLYGILLVFMHDMCNIDKSCIAQFNRERWELHDAADQNENFD